MRFYSRHFSREILSTAFYEPKIKIKSLKETYKPCMTSYAIQCPSPFSSISISQLGFLLVVTEQIFPHQEFLYSFACAGSLVPPRFQFSSHFTHTHTHTHPFSLTICIIHLSGLHSKYQFLEERNQSSFLSIIFFLVPCLVPSPIRLFTCGDYTSNIITN